MQIFIFFFFVIDYLSRGVSVITKMKKGLNVLYQNYTGLYDVKKGNLA